MRKGQANDSLSGLRTALKYRATLQYRKRTVTHGNVSKTRALALLEGADRLVKGRVDGYRIARDSMISLGMDPESKAYPPLLQSDIRVDNPYQYKVIGTGKLSSSWIWTVGPRGDVSADEEIDWEEDGEYNLTVTAHKS